MGKGRWALVLLLLCLSVSGCATLSNVENTEDARLLLKKNSMIFGRIVAERHEVRLVAKNLHNNKIYEIFTPAQRALFSKHKRDNMDQYFFSFLPAGQYQISRMSFTDGVSAGGADINMSFTVPEDAAVYLGSFVCSWTTTKNYLIVQKGNIQYAVYDEREEAIYRLWKRFPELKPEGLSVVVNLFEINQSK